MNNSNEEVRLTYFNFAGSRGEEYRIALHLADVDFDDVRVKSADLPALKERSPSAQCRCWKCRASRRWRTPTPSSSTSAAGTGPSSGRRLRGRKHN
jgi:hypothetical protein